VKMPSLAGDFAKHHLPGRRFFYSWSSQVVSSGRHGDDTANTIVAEHW
jgi:hypothetical protein